MSAPVRASGPSAPTQPALPLPQWLAEEVRLAARSVPALQQRLEQALTALAAESERERSRTVPGRARRQPPLEPVAPSRPALPAARMAVARPAARSAPPRPLPRSQLPATPAPLPPSPRRGLRLAHLHALLMLPAVTIPALGLILADATLLVAGAVLHLLTWAVLLAWLHQAWAALPQASRFVRSVSITPRTMVWRLVIPFYQLGWLVVVIERLATVVEEPERGASPSARGLLRFAVVASMTPLLTLAPLAWALALALVDRPLLERTP